MQTPVGGEDLSVATVKPHDALGNRHAFERRHIAADVTLRGAAVDQACCRRKVSIAAGLGQQAVEHEKARTFRSLQSV